MFVRIGGWIDDPFEIRELAKSLAEGDAENPNWIEISDEKCVEFVEAKAKYEALVEELTNIWRARLAAAYFKSSKKED